jgi:dGTPase
MKPLYSDGDKRREYTVVDDDNSNDSLFEHPPRSEFRRDNGRLIHSAVFRRLQGKTQLFPNYESDFFRNRLTHSIEVAQIAKGIAEQINSYHPYFLNHPIDTDLVETVALAHDLGHPPFGHNGEKALDDMMKDYGGFEGNAQTFRILSKLEKKATIDGNFIPVADSVDLRCGLNLTYRTLAGVLKYDEKIPHNRNPYDKLVKGYYYTEKEIVKKIKDFILGSEKQKGKFKTVECKIMDIADDIAYSTYDIEDAFKAEFLCPL